MTAPQLHGLINYKETKTKGRLYWCFIEFIDWRYSKSGWYFGPSFVNYCSSNLVNLPPPLSSQSQSTLFTDSVWLGGGGGVLSCVGDHILQEFNTLFLTRFRTYKIARPPKQKPRRGGSLSQINTCRKVPLHRLIFLDNDIWHRFLSVQSFYAQLYLL